MKKGDVVKIYEDPGTCKKLEGEAKLLKRINPEYNAPEEFLDHWWVKFLDDGFETNRLVNKDIC